MSIHQLVQKSVPPSRRLRILAEIARLQKEKYEQEESLVRPPANDNYQQK